MRARARVYARVRARLVSTRKPRRFPSTPRFLGYPRKGHSIRFQPFRVTLLYAPR